MTCAVDGTHGVCVTDELLIVNQLEIDPSCLLDMMLLTLL